VQDAQAAGETIGASARHRHAGDADAVAESHGRMACAHLPDLKGLAMLTGGEALPGELARALQERGPQR
jgi:hypothetical protein